MRKVLSLPNQTSLVPMMIRRIFFALICMALYCFAPHNASHASSVPIPQDTSSGIILAYQKIGEDITPETSLSLPQFQNHIEEILNGDYNIIALPDLLKAIDDGHALPPMTVAITFDGLYRSAFEKAFPLLIENKIPFTVFFSPQMIEGDLPYSLTKRELQSLQKHSFIDFGVHSYTLMRHAPASDQSITQEVSGAYQYLKETLPLYTLEKAMFAYPFGEYSTAYQNIVREAGFDAALTLSSGAAYQGIDLYDIPRFAMTERYGNIERLRMVMRAAPLPISDWSPSNQYLRQDSQTILPESFSFHVAPDIKSLDLLRCYVSGQSVPQISVDEANNKVTLTLQEPLSAGRVRVNCTMPGPAVSDVLAPQRYRWHGRLYTIDEVM